MMRSVCYLLFAALSSGLGLACATTPSPSKTQAWTTEQARAEMDQAWNTQPAAILQRITPPSFPNTDYLITDYGAQSGGNFDNVNAIREAIIACSLAGGGRVVIPAGEWFCAGPVHLRSRVNLHLAEGAILRFSDQAEDYLPLVKVRWEGTVAWNYSPLIYAYQQTDIALTGKGEIDGNAQVWSVEWRKKQKPDKTVLRQMGNDQIPDDQRVFGNGFLDRDGDGQDDGFGDGKQHWLRPSLVEFYECDNVLIEGLTLRNSPFWTVHPVFCKSVTIRGLNVYGACLNDDGIDPDSCEDVLIENCYVETRDDAISIKAGRDQDAWERDPCRNVIIRNCRLNSGVNAFCVGSEMSGGVENVFVEDCHILGGKHGLNFKCNLDRGGQVQHIYLRHITMDTVREAMFIFRMDYHGYQGNNYPTRFNNFYATNISCKMVLEKPFKIVGVENEPIQRVYLGHIQIGQAGEDSELAHVQNVLAEEVIIGGKRWSPTTRASPVQ
ncbi:MAG: glycoside hydrolase family 28 protein [Bacteroidetes bacterium]|nr:MAG: glycoside hydrolase family 28 protein [Bacteroidota bacterium]